MSVEDPLTASSDIARSLGSKSASIAKDRPLKPDLGVFASNVVEISKLGIEKNKRKSKLKQLEKLKKLQLR